MRSAALLFLLVAALCLETGSARACSESAPCVDAEPLWLSAHPRRFLTLDDTASSAAGELGVSAALGFRSKPAVLVAPAPSADGREINLIRDATDLSLGAWLGIGRGMELTLSLPVGLYQRGAGIKGVTHQSAPPISQQSLHDPRVGYGFGRAFRYRNWGIFGLKLKLELKLPLGDRSALMGEAGPVLGSSAVTEWRPGRFFIAAEHGVRLRGPTDFYGRRVGTQQVAKLGLGYELPRPHLVFAIEWYGLKSLVARDNAADKPGEWLASTSFTPRAMPRWSFGVAGGTAVPYARGDGFTTGVGAPLWRVLALLRWAPAAD